MSLGNKKDGQIYIGVRKLYFLMRIEKHISRSSILTSYSENWDLNVLIFSVLRTENIFMKNYCLCTCMSKLSSTEWHGHSHRIFSMPSNLLSIWFYSGFISDPLWLQSDFINLRYTCKSLGHFFSFIFHF
jgi:hypothetical protein